MKEKAFGVKLEFSNKYTDKGNNLEDVALAHIGLKKNEESFENDFLTGTPDALEGKVVVDVKNSWDHSTFPFYESKCPNKDYWWQLQGYMILTGYRKAQLEYFLLTNPEGGPNYDHINIEDRIKTFPVEFDETAEEKIKERVALCQKYVDENYKPVRKVEEDLF